MSDNTTAISYANKNGDLKSHVCNKIVKEIWIWCTSRDLHISAAHIPDKDNFEADKISRKFQDATEWQLNPEIFKSDIQNGQHSLGIRRLWSYHAKFH